MSDVTWLAVAFLAVWIGIGGYLAILGARQRSLEHRIHDIEARRESRDG
jgi:CcmD family protein